MKYIHVRNLEKFQPGYTDRKHIWAKIYYELLVGDEQSEELSEVAWCRLVKFIVLETCRQRMTPLDEKFLNRRNFDFGVQSLRETLDELSHFIEIIDVTEPLQECNKTVTEPSPREEKNREEKIRKDIALPEKSIGFKKPSIGDLKALFGEKGFPAEAEKFFDYYEANGWRVGRNPMKNWQSAVANWIRNGKSYGTLESGGKGGSLNKTQTKNMEALGEFLKRKGTARPEDIRSGHDAPQHVLPVSESTA